MGFFSNHQNYSQEPCVKGVLLLLIPPYLAVESAKPEEDAFYILSKLLQSLHCI